MYRHAMYFFLPLIKALLVVQIHQHVVYHPQSSCAFLRNASLSNDASIQSCIWECNSEYDCQTAVYFHDTKTCSMFSEFCTVGRMELSGNAQASVICHRKNHGPTTACPATSTVRPSSGAIVGTTSELPSPRPLVYLTRKDDTIVGLCNTSTGQSTGTFDQSFTSAAETPPNVFDSNTATKYYNFVGSCTYCTDVTRGIGTGFFVVPSISNATVARALLFATANDCPERDPITVSLEGSNATDNATLLLGTSWMLIYNGSTGINSTTDPGRYTYIPQQNFSNIQAFASYRLLVTSKRANSGGVQYSEAHILGYV